MADYSTKCERRDFEQIASLHGAESIAAGAHWKKLLLDIDAASVEKNRPAASDKFTQWG